MKTVWLDAGHGGKDPGAINKTLNLYEKDLTLKLALETEKMLKQQGINVVMTRKTDITMDYIKRFKLENNNNCDLAISLHLNSCKQPNTAKGCEIWIHSKANSEIQNWANNTLAEILKVNGTINRGVKKGYPGYPNLDFWCNRLTKSMSMLVEIGFVNNDEDTRLVMSNYTEYAKAIAKAVCRQLGINYQEQEKQKPDTVEDKPNTNVQIKAVYDFEINNLNDKNLAFLLDSKMSTGETLQEFLKRQVYRFKIVKRD